MALPDLVVFDLDFTLWDCGGLWVDCADYPFSQTEGGSVIDSSGRQLRLYDEVPSILDSLEAQGISMALASRTSQPSWAARLMELLGIRGRFEYEEIFPGSKVAHFENLRRDTGIPFEKMVFFDDEKRNIIEVGRMGVKCVLVERGIDSSVLEQGLSMFAEVE